MNKILTILLILAACCNAMAQHTLTGRIVGTDNAPLPYAVVEDEMAIHFQNVKYVTDENEALHSMIEESRQKLQEKDNQLAVSIKMLAELGVSPEQIAEKLKITVEIVNQTLQS